MTTDDVKLFIGQMQSVDYKNKVNLYVMLLYNKLYMSYIYVYSRYRG